MADEVEYRQMKNPDDARAAFRRQTAIDAERMALFAEADMDAINRLRQTAHGDPMAMGSEASMLSIQAPELRKRADAAMKLAGLDDGDLPWAQFKTDFENRLGQEEEMHVRAMDQFENPEAYGVTVEIARFNALRATARVEAYQSALDHIDRKVPKETATTPKRVSHRRPSEVSDAGTE